MGWAQASLKPAKLGSRLRPCFRPTLVPRFREEPIFGKDAHMGDPVASICFWLATDTFS